MGNENHSAGQSGSGPRQNGLDLETLNSKHASSIDKWYRMYSGASSEITAFEDGTMYLAITVDERQQPPFHELVGKIARSWLHEKELKDASAYVSVIFQTDGRLGALVNPKGMTPDELADRVFKMLRPAVKPEVPIAVTTEQFS